MNVKLTGQSQFIKAPRELVFQMLSSFGKGSLPGAQDESSRILEQVGNSIVAEFMTKSGGRIYRTVEEVKLFPPERITFRHLEGPLAYAQEEFSFLESGDGTELLYTGEIKHRVPFLPGVGWIVALLYIKPKYDAVIRAHMEKSKAAAEARAARSHVFRKPT